MEDENNILSEKAKMNTESNSLAGNQKVYQNQQPKEKLEANEYRNPRRSSRLSRLQVKQSEKLIAENRVNRQAKSRARKLVEPVSGSLEQKEHINPEKVVLNVEFK